MPKTKEAEIVVIPAIEFLDKEGKPITLDKVLEQGDYWVSKNRKGDSWIITHNGVIKLAKVAGIKPPINTTFKLETEKSYVNGMNVEIIADMICEAFITTDGTGIEPMSATLSTPLKCLHGSDQVFHSTGEASRDNTYGISGKYMRTIAEKRAYDRGVLQHLELNERVNVYSEAESPDFIEEPAKPVDQIIEKLSPTLNEILNATSKDELIRIAGNIRDMQLDEEEKAYLRIIWGRKNNEFTESF
jgi:hypothetical protein